jgi:hypothetical protein
VGPTGLADLLTHLSMDLQEFYPLAGSLTALRRDLGWLTEAVTEDERRLGKDLGCRLWHLDDPQRLAFYRRGLAQDQPPSLSLMNEREQRLWLMLMVQLWGSGKQYVPLASALQRLWQVPSIREELVELLDLLQAQIGHLVRPLDWAQPIPIQTHGTYHRAEVFAAFGQLTDQKPYPGREGVLFDTTSRCDLLFVTLKKSEKLFSPTTRYNDYAISPHEFHWESQSTTRASSKTGQRYIHHQQQGSRVLLFVREENRRDGITLPFLCLGFADYVRHERERPMAITWRLQVPIPAEFYPAMAIAV